MACLNITSLSKHIDELRVLLQNNSLDLLAINETRLNETIADNEISISGYNIVRRDRPLNGRNGGGVCFYVRSNINYIVRADLVSDQLENLSIEIIKPRSKRFIVATWYRPPNSPFELFSTFEDFVGKLDADGKEYYIMGDFNCNMLPASFYNAYTQALLNITDIYNLKQLITEPTRITPLSSTLIDVIFTNLPDNTTCSGVSHIGISDHSLIYVYRKISSPSVIKGTSTITYRQFKNFNRNTFRSDILAQPWDDLKGVHNPNEMWLKWKTLFLEVSDVHAPLRSKRVRGFKNPWITTELKKMMHLRDRLKIKAIRSDDAIDWNNFKRSRNNVNNAIKIAKKSYYSKSFTACDGNSRKTWEIINEVTGRKSEKAIINELEFEGKKLTDPTEIAEGFNKFFAEIGPKLSENIEDIDICFDEFVNQSISGNFSFQQISPSLVSSHLRKLCIRKATGLDTVSARLLRECFDLISDSLALIFNRSIETSIFPDEWKSARITPLYKKCGNRSDPSNYRPISIIPVVAKVFERIVYDQVYRYLTEYKLLCCYQSGFRTLHSTVTALIEATDSWSLNVDRGLVNAVVFLDLKKAFDTVNHAILLSKLQAYGIRDFANQWFCSYLRNRKQTCLVDCNKSSDTYLPCGVPQGTILGPLLFLLYINDLPNCLMHSQPRMYADDTSITYASNDVEEIERCVNIDLDRIRIWLAANKLTLNTTKTEFLVIGSRQRLSTLERNPQIEINKFPIKQVSTSKSLGVHIDENLSWESHINEISKKIASGISAIKRIRYFLPFEILLNVYSSLVQPHFDYCNVVWGTVLRTYLLNCRNYRIAPLAF